MSLKSIHAARRLEASLAAGLAAGLAGGLAEVAVVCCYTNATGGDAAAVARGVAASVGIDAMGTYGAAMGLAVHMALGAGLGVALVAALQGLPAWARSYGAVPFMLAALGSVWAVNFFLILPAVSPGFVLLLPYGVTLASKLAFGAASAVVLNMLYPTRRRGFAVMRFTRADFSMRPALTGSSMRSAPIAIRARGARRS